VGGPRCGQYSPNVGEYGTLGGRAIPKARRRPRLCYAPASRTTFVCLRRLHSLLFELRHYLLLFWAVCCSCWRFCRSRSTTSCWPICCVPVTRPV
jgi:hypothetical protein